MSRSADRRISFTAKLLISLSLTLSLSLPLSLWIPFSHPVSSYSSNPIFLTTCLLLLHCKTSYLHTLPQISTPTNFLPPLGRRYFYPQPPVRAPSFYITVLRPCLRHFCLTFCFWSSARPFRHSVQLPFSFVLFSFWRQKSNGKKNRWKWSLFLVRWSDYWESVWCGAES